jgi:hypothetical protein
MYPHFLANLGNDTIYVPREKIEAHCEQYSTIGTLIHPKDHSEQPAPHLTCMCGIYAYKEKPRLLREIRNIYSGLRLVANNRYVPIYGEINLWGKVIEHEDGYRAQFGYPKRLWCTPAIEPLAGWIGYVYGVPCEVMPSGDDEEIKINSPRSIIPKMNRPCYGMTRRSASSGQSPVRSFLARTNAGFASQPPPATRDALRHSWSRFSNLLVNCRRLTTRAFLSATE